ncbi:c oxidase subunit 7A-related, mitochondrial [Octopus vulgaris]|uniref:C oxidase subunit 7A-related, mitochondrial n=1 Tax=Octopus vulgaris TaxID=6645 RepID=A0AA36AXT9_OCTVU|nr:c oxidase subunit 7A-related, mitochondrial [Octopus vulgaris]
MRVARCLFNSLRTPLGTKINSGVVPNTNIYKKVQDLQTQFLRDDGLLVWQKRGTRDRFMYYFSLALMASGGLLSAHILYRMSFGIKDGK